MPGRRAGAAASTRRSCSATSSATAPIPTRSSNASGTLKPRAIVRGNHDKVALRPRTGRRLQRRRARRRGMDVRGARRRSTGRGWRRCRRDRWRSTTSSRSATDRRSTRTLYIFDETDALRALKGMSRPLCLFGHTHYPITFQLAGGELHGDRDRPPRRRRSSSSGRTSYTWSIPGSVGQPRDGDRAPPTRSSTSSGNGWSWCGWSIPSKRRRRRSWRRGCLPVLARRLAVGR